MEQDFRRNCSLFENNAAQPWHSQVYQEYVSTYQKFTSTYLIDNKANLLIYNTEIEKEEVKALEIPECWGCFTPLTQLPNGDLFLTRSNNGSRFAFIIDKNYRIRKLPLGAPNECFGAVYFNQSVYCFGGNYANGPNSSRKFNLNENQWSELAIMSEDLRGYISNIVFNRNILISIDDYCNIWLYAIDIDSFSKIPYNFAACSKILINVEERLYLIECNGWIYENEAGDEYNWKQISNSLIEIYQKQVYCSYNKEGVYISILDYNYREYFKFDLNQKALVEIAFYSENIGLKRSGDKLEAIDCYDQIFRLDPDNAAIYIDKGYTLCYVGKKLEEIEQINIQINAKCDYADYADIWIAKGDTLCDIGRHLEAIACYNEVIKINPDYADVYNNKGIALFELGRPLMAIEDYNKGIKLSPNAIYINHNKGNALDHLERYSEAIECYNEEIKNNPEYACAYINKGNALEKLSRNLEAIECYNEAIELEPYNPGNYVYKGISLCNLDRNDEAIECYNEALKFNPSYACAYINKGNALLKLGRNIEAIESYNEAIQLQPDYADSYFNKGDALSRLGRNLESIECYNEIIKLNPDDADAYNNKGDSLMKLGRNSEAIECFDKIISIKPNHAIAYNNKGEAFYNLEMNAEAIECYNEAIKIEIDEPTFYRNRANALNKLGRQVEALHDFNKTEKLMKNLQTNE